MIGSGELREGMKVRTRDGHELGRIIRFDSSMILIEKGFFFPKDYEVPASLVTEIRDEEAHLSATKDELTSGTWSRSSETTETTTRDQSAWGFGKDEGERREGWQSDRTIGRDDQHRVQLAEEELGASKRMTEAGEVRVRKDVVTERKQIDVPVMREEVHVERVPVSASGKDADLDQDAFKERTVTVPVREEEVEVTKRPRVREEVRISKSANVREQRVEGDVRREEAHIERTDDTTERLAKSERDLDRDTDRDDRGGGILGLGRDDER
jgi:uncharacterized protein (TIGR02271 family)